VDTREQLPLVFPPGILAERGTLETGDYCLQAAPALCVVERKSVGDLLGCITAARARFERELDRLACFPAPCAIVIDDITLPELWRGEWATPCRAHPASVVGSLIAWAQRHNVHVLPAGDRACAAALTVGWLRRAFVEATQAA
jgi:DNA excision repair protein ERCC-4